MIPLIDQADKLVKDRIIEPSIQYPPKGMADLALARYKKSPKKRGLLRPGQDAPEGIIPNNVTRCDLSIPGDGKLQLEIIPALRGKSIFG